MTLLIVSAGCASSPLEREFPVDDSIRVELLNDGLLVEGNPATMELLPDVVAGVKRVRGDAAKNALLVIRMEQKPGEIQSAFEKRREHAKADLMDALVALGIRQIHLGLPPKPTTPK